MFPAASFDRVLLDPPCSALGLRPSLRVGGVSAWSDAKATRVSAEARPHPRPRPVQTGRTSLPAPYKTVFLLAFVASWSHIDHDVYETGLMKPRRRPCSRPRRPASIAARLGGRVQ